MGAARACYESAREYAKAREQFGAPIASFQLPQEKPGTAPSATREGLPGAAGALSRLLLAHRH